VIGSTPFSARARGMRRDEIRNNGQVIASFSIRKIYSMPEVDEGKRQGKGKEGRFGDAKPP
jgi:hypothetical protein